jgi:hypothetical protein
MRRRQRMSGRAPSRSSGLANRAKLARSVGSQRQIHLPWYHIGGVRLSPQLHEADLESHSGALPWSCVAELADLGSAGGAPRCLCVADLAGLGSAGGAPLWPRAAELPRGYVWWSLCKESDAR